MFFKFFLKLYVSRVIVVSRLDQNCRLVPIRNWGYIDQNNEGPVALELSRRTNYKW